MDFDINVPEVNVFQPKWDEFKDFNGFITNIEAKGAHKAGIAKVVPPREWVARKSGYENLDLMKINIQNPICQVIFGNADYYQQIIVEKKAMTAKVFKNLCETPRYRTPSYNSYTDLEEQYWNTINSLPPIYGSDIHGSLIDEDQQIWNLNNLGTILDLSIEDDNGGLEGVHSSYLYFGMWKSTFGWHTEDMDLYSISYLHFGAPKTWYAIPPQYGRQFENLAKELFPATYNNCNAFLRHKLTIISPKILNEHKIPFHKVTQEPGEFIITFPYGYHAGFNNGFNCAEATNFATERWVEYGKRVKYCLCNEPVTISMNPFIKRFQPQLYEAWLAGCDMGIHPEDPEDTTPTTALLPNNLIFQNKNLKQKCPDINISQLCKNKYIPKYKKKLFRRNYK